MVAKGKKFVCRWRERSGQHAKQCSRGTGGGERRNGLHGRWLREKTKEMQRGDERVKDWSAMEELLSSCGHLRDL